jgi:phosphatidylserine/phosphatidylglycerophosphate/cardiolipin synthase-like enzyme
MFSLKEKGITLLLLASVYIWFFIGHLPNLNQTNTKVLSAQANVYVFTQPESGRKVIVNEINNARHEILVEIYLLSDKEIIDSLCKARQKGLAVNVMLERHPFGGGNLNSKTKETLIKCDISVNWTNPQFALTHEKSIILDGKEVFILNQNLTVSSFSKNREYDVLDTDLNDAKQVREIFIKDWKRENFTPRSSHLIISPNNSRAEIEKTISESATEIDIEDEIVDDERIISLLTQLAKKEKVRLIAPSLSQISSNKKALDKLKAGGVEVKTLSSPYIHAKLILVDNKKAYIGSINLSSQSLDRNREVGIIITEINSINNIKSTFESDWTRAASY